MEVGSGAFFPFSPVARVADGTRPPGDLAGLLDGGWLVAEPIVYEDFLPRSAAGIFASNLSDRGEVDASHGGAYRDGDWLSGAIGRPIRVPEQVYPEQRAESLAAAAAALGIAGDITVDPEPAGLSPSGSGRR